MDRPARTLCVLFDFDGTLCDTEPAGVRHIDTVLRSYGVVLSRDELVSLVGHDDRTTIPPFLERAGVPQTIDDYLCDLEACPNAYFSDPIEPIEGVIDFITGLRERGIKCAVVSSSSTANVVMALNRMGMLRLFDAVVCSEMSGLLKPNPDPYLCALDLLGIEAKSCVAFEDSPSGIVAAQAAGIYTIGFTGGSIVQDLPTADEIVSCWREARV